MAGGRPIEIKIKADADASGVDKVADALEGVEDNLESVETSAKDAGKTLEREIGDSAKDAAQDAEKGLEDVEKGLEGVEDAAKSAGKELESELGDAAKEIDRDLTQALESVEDQAKATGSKVGKELGDGFDKAGEGAEEFKDESTQIAKESATSFTGEFEDVTDVIRDLMANAFVGFGPAGVAAGVAAAAGIGILISQLQKGEEEAAEARDRINELAGEIREADHDLTRIDWVSKFQEWGDTIEDAKSWWEPWQDASVTALDDAKEHADDFGLSLESVALGLSGHMEAADKAIGQVDERLLSARDAAQRLVDDGMDPMDAAVETGVIRLGELRDRLVESRDETATATEYAELYEEAIKGTVVELQAQREELEELNDVIRDSRDAKVDLIQAELDYWETISASNEVLMENEKTLETNTEVGRENTTALLEMAEAAVGLADAEFEATGNAERANEIIREQKQAFIDSAVEAGFNAEEVQNLADTMFGVPEYVQTDFDTPGVDEAKRKAEDLTAAIENVPGHKRIQFAVDVPPAWEVQRTVDGLVSSIKTPTLYIPLQPQGPGSRYIS